MIFSLVVYFFVMLILYFLKDTIVPTCDTYNSTINIIIFLLHLFMILISIFLVRSKIKDHNIRYLVNSGFTVFYLLMLYICLKFELYLVICNI